MALLLQLMVTAGRPVGPNKVGSSSTQHTRVASAPPPQQHPPVRSLVADHANDIAELEGKLGSPVGSPKTPLALPPVQRHLGKDHSSAWVVKPGLSPALIGLHGSGLPHKVRPTQRSCLRTTDQAASAAGGREPALDASYMKHRGDHSRCSTRRRITPTLAASSCRLLGRAACPAPRRLFQPACCPLAAGLAVRAGGQGVQVLLHLLRLCE